MWRGLCQPCFQKPYVVNGFPVPCRDGTSDGHTSNRREGLPQLLHEQQQRLAYINMA